MEIGETYLTMSSNKKKSCDFLGDWFKINEAGMLYVICLTEVSYEKTSLDGWVEREKGRVVMGNFYSLETDFRIMYNPEEYEEPFILYNQYE